jgi:hypothetical protein
VLNRSFSGLGRLARPCYSTPGPADTRLFCKRSAVTGYWLGWRWYKFVDQPALQRLNLSQAERSFMQQRVETLHGMVGTISRWLKPGKVPAAGAKLAELDPVALVSESAVPKGLEKGYVPIALWESQERPEEGCVEVE